MCAIYGQFGQSNLNRLQELDRLNLMEHRGPDGFGIVCGDWQTETVYSYINKKPASNQESCNFFIGHRRLAINDLSAAADQPLFDISQRYVITFNGEIYNYVELKKELVEAGVKFQTDHSDTEILLQSYIKYGEKCLERFIGMFAFAIYDRQKKKIFIARDRIGQKPFYYFFDGQKFLFASELWPLVKLGEKLKINQRSLQQYLVYGYIPHPHSIFEGINKLPPASYAVIELDKMSMDIKEYWTLSGSLDQRQTEDSWLAALKKELQRAVSLRLRADVPYGIFISGGIDSSVIAKNVKAVSQSPIDGYAADFPDPQYSERIYQDQVAEKYDINLDITSLDMKSAAGYLDVINTFDEPFDGGSAIPLFEMFKKIQGQKKIMLTGDGGDELFAGYVRYQNYLRRYKLVKLIRISLIGLPLCKLIFSLGYKKSGLRELIKRLELGELAYYLQWRYDAEMADLLIKKQPVEDFYQQIASSSPYTGLKLFQWLELKTLLPGRMLYKLDRISMKYGIEGRSPFMDHKLVETAFQIPEHFNVDKNKTKQLLKNILLEDFDESFVNRPKKGFGNPLEFWFSNDKEGEMFKLLHDKSAAIYSYLNWDAVQLKFPEIKKGFQGQHAKELWRLLVLAVYLEKVKDKLQPLEQIA